MKRGEKLINNKFVQAYYPEERYDDLMAMAKAIIRDMTAFITKLEGKQP